MRSTASFKDILMQKMNAESASNSYAEIDSMPFLGQMLGQISRREFDQKPSVRAAYKSPATKNKPAKPIRPDWIFNEIQEKAFIQFEIWGAKLERNFEASALKQAFRKLALKLHPDQSKGDARAFLALKQHHAELLQLIQKTK